MDVWFQHDWTACPSNSTFNTHSSFIHEHPRSAMSRLSHSQALLGPDLFKQIRETPVLVVGAGGIGCELRESPCSR